MENGTDQHYTDHLFSFSLYCWPPIFASSYKYYKFPSFVPIVTTLDVFNIWGILIWMLVHYVKPSLRLASVFWLLQNLLQRRKTLKKGKLRRVLIFFSSLPLFQNVNCLGRVLQRPSLPSTKRVPTVKFSAALLLLHSRPDSWLKLGFNLRGNALFFLRSASLFTVIPTDHLHNPMMRVKLELQSWSTCAFLKTCKQIIRSEENGAAAVWMFTASTIISNSTLSSIWITSGEKEKTLGKTH